MLLIHKRKVKQEIVIVITKMKNMGVEYPKTGDRMLLRLDQRGLVKSIMSLKMKRLIRLGLQGTLFSLLFFS